MTRAVPVPGEVFLHYKGTYYEVLCIATHTETKEEVVVYRQCLDPTAPVWVRPVSMFCEKIGEMRNVDRFMPIPKETLEVLKRSGVL